jgi:hypothetical protein
MLTEALASSPDSKVSRAVLILPAQFVHLMPDTLMEYIFGLVNIFIFVFKNAIFSHFITKSLPQFMTET